MTDLKSSETAAEGSIELTNEYLRLADVLKVFEYAVGGGPTREKSREVAEKLHYIFQKYFQLGYHAI